MKVAEGKVADRPFARTIFSLAAKRFTGDFKLSAAGAEYKSSWEGGRVVAATSAATADSPGRIALSAGLVNSTTVSKVMGLAAENPSADLLGLLAEHGKLSPEAQVKLKRSILAHAATRIFAFPDARFEVDNARSMSADPQVSPLDPRWLIYRGLRSHYSIERLQRELQPIGNRRLQLKEQALKVLSAFGFGKNVAQLLASLREHAEPIHAILRRNPGVDQAEALSVVYALVACNYTEISQGRARSISQTHNAPPTVSPTAPITAAGVPSLRRKAQAAAQPGARSATAETRSRSSLAAGPPKASGFVKPAARNEHSPAAEETRQLIREKVALLDAERSHYELLGVDASATPKEIRQAYFSLAKRLHPDRLRAVGVGDMDGDSQRLFSAINSAFAVLSDVKKAHEYKKMLAAGGTKAAQEAQRQAEELAVKIVSAEEHFHLGEMALRRNQYRSARDQFAKAKELNPEEGEYLAFFAWADFCASEGANVADAQANLREALKRSPRSANVHFYNGRVLKALGREDQALAAFNEVLKLDKSHHDAQLEVRVLSGRLKR